MFIVSTIRTPPAANARRASARKRNVCAAGQCSTTWKETTAPRLPDGPACLHGYAARLDAARGDPLFTEQPEELAPPAPRVEDRSGKTPEEREIELLLPRDVLGRPPEALLEKGVDALRKPGSRHGSVSGADRICPRRAGLQIGEARILAGVAPPRLFAPQGEIRRQFLEPANGRRMVLLERARDSVARLQQEGVEGGLTPPQKSEEPNGRRFGSEEPRRVRYRRRDVSFGAPQRSPDVLETFRFEPGRGRPGFRRSRLRDGGADLPRELVREVVGSSGHEAGIISHSRGPRRRNRWHPDCGRVRRVSSLPARS